MDEKLYSIIYTGVTAYDVAHSTPGLPALFAAVLRKVLTAMPLFLTLIKNISKLSASRR